eukprot:TRINITY_DN22712_c0_g1_i1.p1 TRINITY_DN22712_c0_g1~~TRINITY_DN22712_c0_g1_i1.p1  ORF type:complete len:543 (+),score=146.50 TRINITY_DN22712_c0_g1_i1:426-2054(+)
MRFLILAAFALAVAVATSEAYSNAPAPPTWPSQYTAKGIFRIPYFNIVEPVDIHYDGVNNRERLDYYHGMDRYIWRFDLGVLYEVVPRIDTLFCMMPNITGDGPMTTVLPDLTNWSFNGTTSIEHVKANQWITSVTNLNKTANYSMWTSIKDGKPLRLVLNGYDFIFGSHPDIYIFDYSEYHPNVVNASVFDMPAECANVSTSPATRGLRARALLGQLSALTPPTESNDPFRYFMMKHNKAYGPEELEYRRSIFEANSKFIQEHNARTDVTYKVAMNQFGDLTPEEMQAVMRPKPAVSRKEMLKTLQFTDTHFPSGKDLPASIDWVQKGAVNPPKDQGACGSCWTFGTVGTLEGVWFVKTGNLLSFSEQQIVDCAWANWGGDGGNMGCDGGYAAPAIQWVINNGGIATEASYRYLMQDGYCNATDISGGITVKGYVNVSSSEDALQDAVATAGPTAVAIDASHPGFTFYISGTYYEPTCGNTLDDLDHEVLAVGYGTDENGQDFWLVKNSWSTHWGNQGFIRMSRNRDNNCGIATQATYPLV